MEKLDLTKLHKSYYTARTKPEMVEIAPAQYLSVTGMGDPSERPFAERIEALYSVAYAIKFAYKAKEKDFTVAKLEGLWWYDETQFPGKTIETAVEIPRSVWEYRLLIRMPDFVTEESIATAVNSVFSKKGLELAKEVAFFQMSEGNCVQMLHIGPFATEPETLKVMAAFMDEKQLSRNGLHHEIYLSDFRKTEAEKLKTILREPVK